MPRGPKGERRPADVNARAVMIAKIATGQTPDVIPTPESEGKDPTCGYDYTQRRAEGLLRCGRRPPKAALLQAAVKSTQTICEHVSEVCSQFDPTRRSGSMRFSASVRRFF